MSVLLKGIIHEFSGFNPGDVMAIVIGEIKGISLVCIYCYFEPRNHI